MKIPSKDIINITLLVISVLMFVGIINWGKYLINTRCKEGFESFSEPQIDKGTPQTSHTVNLPINTTFQCENMCGPLARCSKTGEQCTSDVDCYGCQPTVVAPINQIYGDVRGQNDAGKQTNGQTPTYSILTTDIGTQAKFYGKGENPIPDQYFKGVDEWRGSFDAGMDLYNKKFNPNIEVLPFLPKYPTRVTLSGEFIDDGPLASNAYLANE
jgi:hypothetical protein